MVTIVSARYDGPWKLGSAAVVLAFALDPLGTLPGVLIFVVVLVAALQAFSARRMNEATGFALLALTGVVIVIAALEVLNPNVPSLTVGLLGFRKSATFFLGIAIGLGWRGSRLQGLRLTWWCMFVAAAVSLVVHLALPSLEQSIPRSADKYTSLIDDVTRMQGLFAGPFHVSMAGVFLFLAALAPGYVIRSRALRIASATVGLACVYFAEVRTGIVAVAIGAVVMMLVTGSRGRWTHRLLMLLALGGLSVMYIGPLTEQARKLTAFRRLLDNGLDDTRFTGRFATWTTSLDMIDESPFIGSGSGSAGDTLGVYFAAGQHVTSHNTFLKYAVEGGIFQGVLVAALCVGIVVAARPSRDPTRFGVAAGVTFLVFAAVGAAPESIPMSLGLAVILGLCTQNTVSPGRLGARGLADVGSIRLFDHSAEERRSRPQFHEISTRR